MFLKIIFYDLMYRKELQLLPNTKKKDSDNSDLGWQSKDYSRAFPGGSEAKTLSSNAGSRVCPCSGSQIPESCP